MLNNLEVEKRAAIPEASDELVVPFRRLVNVAMQSVREGTIDRLKRQSVELSDNKNNIMYQITDVSVDELGGVVISTRNLGLGLFIHGFKLYRAENLENLFNKSGLFFIGVPRDPDQVNKVSLYSLRGSNPKEVGKVAVALSSAIKI